MVGNPFRRRRPALCDEDESPEATVEASDKVLLLLDEQERVVAASRGARDAFPELELGEPLRGQAERVAYEELRSGFTAVVSHELRTPLARLLALLETVSLPDVDDTELLEQAHTEVEQMGELIDEVLFLSELESGREVVSLAPTRALPVVEDVLARLADAAGRAGVELRAEGDPELELPLRPRMLTAVAENLAENAIRYAGQGASFTLSVEHDGDARVLRARDDGVGVPESELGRLFERFYRADRARTSRGTGLGLAIVKHIVTSAGGRIEARGGPGAGLEIRCSFPA